MTKGLTGLASHNSNMAAPHEQNYEGGRTIYRTKRSRRAEKLSKRNTQSFFEDDLEDSSYHSLFSASSTTSSTSTGTKTSYADIVKGIGHKSQPPMKIKTKTFWWWKYLFRNYLRSFLPQKYPENNHTINSTPRAISTKPRKETK